MDRQFELGFTWKVCLCGSHFAKTAGLVGKTKILLLMLFLMLGHMPAVIQENKSGSTFLLRPWLGTLTYQSLPHSIGQGMPSQQIFPALRSGETDLTLLELGNHMYLFVFSTYH